VKLTLYLLVGSILFTCCHKDDVLEPPYGNKPVTVVTNRDYTSFLLSALHESKDYVYIAMYIMKYYPFDSSCGESQLLNAIIETKQRGVEVKVLLELSDYNSSLNETNESTYVYLTSKSVNVRFDSPTVTTHAKLVIIDGKIAFVGSTNWTKSALEANNEVNVEVKDEDVVGELELYFENLWGSSRRF